MKKINVITLGCSKNTVDSEHLMARLAAAGYEVLFDSDRTDAKVVVINTCGFIGDAKQESIDMILRAAAAKQAGKIERLFVVGCLSERYADELRAEIPEVDDYFGARTWDGIVRALGASEDPALATERRLTTPKHYAYLKISEGCNWKCGYCAIPLIRGAHVSVPMEELEEEARKLKKKLVKNQFNFNDFISQIQQIKKMGNLKDLAGMLPGMGKMLKNVDIPDDVFKQTEAIISSMTPAEREQFTDALFDVLSLSGKARTLDDLRSGGLAGGAALLKQYAGADEEKKKIIVEIFRRLAVDVKDELKKAAGEGFEGVKKAAGEGLEGVKTVLTNLTKGEK